jgi:protein-tyrosine phosphatase
MIPLADMHCHLLAGLDDGPRTEEDALQMCRLAHAEGTRFLAAGAHQSERYRANTPQRIREAAGRLARRLRAERIEVSVFPCAEVMAHPELVASWKKGELLSVADRGEYLLVEMPHNLVVDLRPTVRRLCAAGVRPILAHPERCEELLHDAGRIEELIGLGCLVQVSTGSITHPPSRRDEQALKGWLKRGVVHVLGSDGHSPTRRPPRMAEAYRKVARWAGASVADRVASTNGTAISQGLPLHIPEPEPHRAGRFAGWW